MSRWDEIFEEKPSATHAARVRASVEPLLEQARLSDRRRLWGWVLGAGVGVTAAIAGVVRVRNQDPEGERAMVAMGSEVAGEILDAGAEDIELLQASLEISDDEWDVLDELDVLEELEDEDFTDV